MIVWELISNSGYDFLSNRIIFIHQKLTNRYKRKTVVAVVFVKNYWLRSEEPTDTLRNRQNPEYLQILGRSFYIKNVFLYFVPRI